jgi:hypothetical protein
MAGPKKNLQLVTEGTTVTLQPRDQSEIVIVNEAFVSTNHKARNDSVNGLHD